MAFRMRGTVSLLAVALAVTACGSESPMSSDPLDAPPASPLGLGSVRTTTASTRDCPAGVQCRGIEVTCPGIPAAPAFVGVASPRAPPRGVVLFTSGGSGMGWALGPRDRGELLDQLLDDGFEVVQLAWATNWLESAPGNDAGPHRLGCRPATVVKWVHDTYFLPLGIQRSAEGRCGFCITGNSGGATQSSYPLSHYGLDEILDAVVPTGGPPHAALTRSCLGTGSTPAYTFADDTRRFIDRGFGFFDGNGPCSRRDATFTARWDEAAVSVGGTDYTHPRTRVHFVFGDGDQPMQAIGGDYAARLRGGSPWVTVEVAPATGHGTTNTEQGRRAVRAALLATR